MLNRQHGQGFLEYLLLTFLLGIISVSAIKITGVDVGAIFSKVSDTLSNKSNVVFSDTFSDLSNWKSILGPNRWSAVDGNLVTMSAGDQRIMETSALPDDYVITTTAQLLSGGGYGIMFRLTPSGNSYAGYAFQLDEGYGNKFVLRKYSTNGTEISIPIAVASPPAGFDFYAPHQITLSVVGNTYTAYLDGTKVMTATDDSYTSGSAGLRTWWSNQVKISDFSVSAP
jgi:hypothetical protein